MGDIDRDLKGRRVLIVEDESAITMLLEELLLDIGCEITAVASRLPEALEKASSAAFDVAVLDVNLNGQQTFDVARLLQARGTPFVFSTGYGKGIVPEELHGIPVLQKPFLQESLEAALRAALYT